MLMLFSLFYMYSRKIMPDTFSVGLCFMGMFCLSVYDREKKIYPLLGGFLLITLGVLSKLPAAVVLVFLWPLIQRNTWPGRVVLGAVLAFAGGISALWYFYWVPYLVGTFGFQHFFMGASVGETLGFLSDNVLLSLEMFYKRALGYSGFLLFLAGLLVWKQGSKHDAVISGLSVLVFAAFLSKSGNNFYRHEYYVIPMISVMAFIASRVLLALPRYWAVVALLVVGVEGLARKWDDQFISKLPELAHLEEMIEEHVKPADLVVVNSGLYPTPMYFAHRKGWLAANEQLLDPEYVRSLTRKGCKYALIMKKRFGSEVRLPYTVSKETDWFTLYNLGNGSMAGK